MLQTRGERPAQEQVWLVVLDIDSSGALYLGWINGSKQGVQDVRYANVYTERGARRLAAQYPRAVVARAW